MTQNNILKDFYPTPPKLIDKMIEGVVDIEVGANDLRILEPSAGKGDIVDYLVEKKFYYSNNHWSESIATKQIDCIESNPELVHILEGKEYKVISNDFLSYSPRYYYDLIIMNPPFSNGVDHLLHAWEILKDGEIRCLLNSETIKNPYTNARKKLLKIIENHGEVEHLGSAFSQSERKTEIKVSLVKLVKKDSKDFKFLFEEITQEKEYSFDEDTINNEVALNDTIGLIVDQYEQVREIFVKVYQAKHRLNILTTRLLGDDSYKTDDLLKNHLPKLKETRICDFKRYLNNFTDELKDETWRFIFSRFHLSHLMTQSVSREFADYKNNSSKMDITKENIDNLIHSLFVSRKSIAEQSILDLFDKMIKYDERNILYYDGFKTNSHYKVNKRVIIPFMIKWDKYWGFQLNYHRESFLNDLDIAMGLLSGMKPGTFNRTTHILEAVFKQIKGGMRKENIMDTVFFEIKFFKKGTIHLKFKDDYLWEQFNLFVARKRNWIPDDIKTKKGKRSKKSTKDGQLILI